MRAIPPTFLLLRQRPARFARRGGIAFDFNVADPQPVPCSGRAVPVGFRPAAPNLAPALRRGLFGSRLPAALRRSLADGVDHGKFPFSTAMDAVDSGTIKTLTRGSHTWSRNTSLSHRLLRSRLLAASKAAATATHRPQTVQPCAPSVALPLARLSPVQPAGPRPKARLSALSRAAARAWFRAPTTAIDLTAAANGRRGVIFENSKTGSFSHSGWRAFFICGPWSGPAMSEGRES